MNENFLNAWGRMKINHAIKYLYKGKCKWCNFKNNNSYHIIIQYLHETSITALLYLYYIHVLNGIGIFMHMQLGLNILNLCFHWNILFFAFASTIKNAVKYRFKDIYLRKVNQVQSSLFSFYFCINVVQKM